MPHTYARGAFAATLLRLAGCGGVAIVDQDASEPPPCSGPPVPCQIYSYVDGGCVNAPLCPPVPHAVVKCLVSADACVITTCAPGWSDCDHDPTNGCEQEGVCS